MRWNWTVVAFGSLVAGCTSEKGDSGLVAQDDADGDTILDVHEDPTGDTPDADDDGTPNRLDLDSDGDNIKDQVEAGDNAFDTLPIDSDLDGEPDFLDRNSDNNCLDDQVEKVRDVGLAIDSDEDGDPDFRDFDNDGDGILDEIEMEADCSIPDTDGDGEPDHLDIDSDDDGIGDLWEGGTTEFNPEPRDTDRDGIPDYRELDADDDGYPDALEGGVSDPTQRPRDTDGDGVFDFQDDDSDGDGLLDAEEASVYGTDPYDNDTDGDGDTDGAEVVAETNPLDPLDRVSGVSVTVEQREVEEAVFSFDLKIDKADIAFMVDTTCSMGSTANAMTAEYGNITSALTAQLDDLAFGVATYDDYPFEGMGVAGTDDAFKLRMEMTDDYDAVQNTLAGVPIHSGWDSPESTMEALRQAATGIGYDLDCDGLYEPTTDVPPYISGADDAFGGTSIQAKSGSLEAGDIGGFGFRDNALPVIIYATDNRLRDPEADDPTPGGCPNDAGFTDVVDGVNGIGAYLIGIGVGPSGDLPIPQMEALAVATGSYGDVDGVGPLVLRWNGTDAEFRDAIVNAVFDLVGALAFDEISLVIKDDPKRFVSRITPDRFTDIGELDEESVEFVLEFTGRVPQLAEDQIFKLTLQVLGDGAILLAERDILVRVPGLESLE